MMLSFLQLNGSHHDVGVALGQFGAQALHHYAKTSPAWQHVMAFRDHSLVKHMQQHVQAQHPDYWAELQGLAQGLEMPLADVFTWNCRGDLWAWAPDGCTTIQKPGAPNRLAHNEDGDPLFAGYCAMVHIQTESDPGFTAFVYPGSLPGHTFGANAAGLCMTVNNLRTLHAQAGLPRMVVTRAMIGMPNLADALRYVQSVKPAGGFHVTLGQANQRHLVSVEFSHRQCSVVELNKASGHANHMIHAAMQHQPQIVTGSSGFRQIRLEQCLQAHADIEPLEILFDTQTAEFPVFRADPADPDQENTLASARFEVGTDALQWQVHQGQCFEPVYRFKNDQLMTPDVKATNACNMATNP
ncbi:MAG TPA: C45 family peptidase [Orrella sp.]